MNFIHFENILNRLSNSRCPLNRHIKYRSIEFYNNNNIIIYYKGDKDEGIFFNRKEFKIYVENNSDYDIKIECDKFVINKYKVYNYMTLEVESGLRGNDTISIIFQTLKTRFCQCMQKA